MDFRGFTLDEGDGPVLRLERRYDQTVERVWRALTDPAELQHWFPGELEIIASEPPHRLLGAWQGEGTLRFELQPQATDARWSSLMPSPTAVRQHWLARAGTAALPVWTRCSPGTR
jgi:hypothetical protein